MYQINWSELAKLDERERFETLAELPDQVKARCAAARAQLVLAVLHRERTAERAGTVLGVTKQRIGQILNAYRALPDVEVITLSRADDEGVEEMTLIRDGAEVRQIVSADGTVTNDTVIHDGLDSGDWLRARLADYSADGWHTR